MYNSAEHASMQIFMRLTVGLCGDLRDGLGKETVLKSGGFGEQSSVAPTRGRQPEQLVSREWGVFSNGCCPGPDSGHGEVLDEGQVGPSGLSFRPHSPLQFVSVLLGGHGQTSDRHAENRLDHMWANYGLGAKCSLLNFLILPAEPEEIIFIESN